MNLAELTPRFRSHAPTRETQLIVVETGEVLAACSWDELPGARDHWMREVLRRFFCGSTDLGPEDEQRRQRPCNGCGLWLTEE